ncbi:hypothetical protein [Vibrio sp. 1180_3]|uniref:hypothetical protein n=1 Tax=Vibrio sp. 1180_3 TaxID=2528832 RepID=UPI0024072CF4|nr:hypothetical protein [Vibrio sp. 1180_3]MDF9399153.1 hypothetical protein [Vibrio sp. 1180_3]
MRSQSLIDNRVVTFSDFKESQSLEPEKDYFFYEGIVNCNEKNFKQWLKRRPLFAIHNVNVGNFTEAKLTTKHWERLAISYKRHQAESELVSQYPDGYFEALNQDGQVACFLPEPCLKMKNNGYKFRLSFFDKDGPRYHECFKTKDEALLQLAKKQYVYTGESILDGLTQCDDWDRGMWMTKWISENITPMDGLSRDKGIPEVSYLFSAWL